MWQLIWQENPPSLLPTPCPKRDELCNLSKWAYKLHLTEKEKEFPSVGRKLLPVRGHEFHSSLTRDLLHDLEKVTIKKFLCGCYRSCY